MKTKIKLRNSHYRLWIKKWGIHRWTFYAASTGNFLESAYASYARSCDDDEDDDCDDGGGGGAAAAAADDDYDDHDPDVANDHDHDDEGNWWYDFSYSDNNCPRIDLE